MNVYCWHLYEDYKTFKTIQMRLIVVSGLTFFKRFNNFSTTDYFQIPKGSLQLKMKQYE